MEAYGRDSGSSIPCRLVEDAAGCRLIDGEGSPDLYPGNSRDDASHDGAFGGWSYSTELMGGSYTILHTGYDNPYTQVRRVLRTSSVVRARWSCRGVNHTHAWCGSMVQRGHPGPPCTCVGCRCTLVRAPPVVRNRRDLTRRAVAFKPLRCSALLVALFCTSPICRGGAASSCALFVSAGALHDPRWRRRGAGGADRGAGAPGEGGRAGVQARSNACQTGLRVRPSRGGLWRAGRACARVAVGGGGMIRAVQ